MSDKQEIRKEIEAAVNTKDPVMLKNIGCELDLMDITDGLDGKPVLESFHQMWKENIGNPGIDNKGNSWTAYHIGMTAKQPDGEFMPARRAFVRPEPPDVDGDFDDERRDEVYQYLIDKYGRDCVGNIGTYIKQKLKAAIRNITRATDAANAFYKGSEECTTANYELANEIGRTLPVLPTGVIKFTTPDGKEIKIKDAKTAYKYLSDFKRYMDKYPDILKHSANIEGLVGAFGCLAADTPVLTQKGWVRIDQLDKSCNIAYLDNAGNIRYSSNFLSFRTGVKPLYRMKLDNGNCIDVTDEHLIFTDQDCVPFENIRKNIKKYKVYSVKV